MLGLNYIPFDFNLYSSLLLPPFIQALVFAVLLFVRSIKEGIKSDILIGLLLVLSAIKIASWMLGFAGWYDTHDGYTSFMFYFPFDNIILAGPLMYFYFLSLTNSEFRFQKSYWPHLVLPAAWVLFILGKWLIDYTVYAPFPTGESFQYGTRGPIAEADKHPGIVFLSYLIFLYYSQLTLKANSRYQLYLKRNFSDTGEIKFRWIAWLIYALIAGVMIFFLFELISLFNKGSNYKFNWYAYLGLGLISYYLGISAYFNPPRLLHRLHFIAEPVANPAKDNLNDMEEWKSRLLDFMDASKPFLEPDLTLGELSRMLSTNTSLLSKVINDGTGRNFNDFINFYRVKDVIRRIHSGEHQIQTLLGIALDSGFNSKATFNRSFKKVTGKTPREYIQTLPSSMI